jgi:hypothetical protein
MTASQHVPAAPAARPSPPRRRSRAKPKPPRARLVVISELRGLGGLVLEQALLDRTAEPQASLVAWANRLAAELAVEGVGSPADYCELMQAIVAVNRRAAADPDRPTVAIPPAAAA